LTRWKKPCKIGAKRRGQLASNNPTTLRLFAQSVNLMKAEAQLLFLERDSFCFASKPKLSASKPLSKV
jgi:hypothetical protein